MLKKLSQAFTLIELLIVIVIIGVLSTALIPRIKSIQAQARDTRRLADVRAIQNALEMYYADHGRYPSSSGCGATTPNGSWCNSSQSLSGGYWIARGALTPYLPGGDPADPKPKTIPDWSPAGGAYFYYSANSSDRGCAPGQSYRLVLSLERIQSPVYGVACDGTVIGGGNYMIFKYQ